MANLIKGLVSQDLRRYKDDAYDLDLTYIIHPTIIAMGFPATGVEGYFRNHIEDIARYLNDKHKAHYLVFNLSERVYDFRLFDTKVNRVINMAFPDHHSPPLLLFFKILIKLDEWLKADTRNVVVVHCLAGRGRTGTIITGYLLFAGICPTIQLALTFYAHQRSSTQQGVSQPSQRRCAHYIDTILRYRIYPKPKRLRLTKLVFGPAPQISSRGGWRPLVYLYYYSNCKEEPLYVSEVSKERAKLISDGKYVVCNLAKKNIIMYGDIVLKISHIGGLISTKYEEIVRLIFHTGIETITQWEGGFLSGIPDEPPQDVGSIPVKVTTTPFNCDEGEDEEPPHDRPNTHIKTTGRTIDEGEDEEPPQDRPNRHIKATGSPESISPESSFFSEIPLTSYFSDRSHFPELETEDHGDTNSWEIKNSTVSPQTPQAPPQASTQVLPPAPPQPPTQATPQASTQAPPPAPPQPPIQATAHVPAKSPTHAPAHTTAHVPPQSPTHAPAHTTAHVPTHGPAHAPAHTTAHVPTHGPAHAPAHTTAHVPPQSPTHAPAHTTAHVPTHAPAHTTAHVPAQNPPPSPAYTQGHPQQYYQEFQTTPQSPTRTKHNPTSPTKPFYPPLPQPPTLPSYLNPSLSQSQPHPPQSLQQYPLSYLSQPQSPQPHLPQLPSAGARLLVFTKKDLDNAYKMDNVKFPANFTITFECVVLDDDDLPAGAWDEELYQEFITTYEINKNSHKKHIYKAYTEEDTLLDAGDDLETEVETGTPEAGTEAGAVETGADLETVEETGEEAGAVEAVADPETGEEAGAVEVIADPETGTLTKEECDLEGEPVTENSALLV